MSSITSRLLDETHKDAEKVRQGLASLDMDFVLELQVYYDELISKSVSISSSGSPAQRPIMYLTDEFPLALGKAVSKRNREDLKLQLSSLVYGETEFRRCVSCPPPTLLIDIANPRLHPSVLVTSSRR